MKQKLFTILTLLLCICSTAWAQTVYEYTNTPALNTNSFFTAAKGSSSVSQYSLPSNFSVVLANGKSSKLTKAVKMEGSTTITFTTTAKSYVQVGLYARYAKSADSKNNTFKFDNVAKEATGATTADSYEIVTIADVAAGDHTIAQNGKEVEIYYVRVVELASDKPTVVANPVSAKYAENATSVTPLSVTAAASAGTLSYQWYSCSTVSKGDATAISGATSATYTPPVNVEGTKYYYCTITDNNGSVDSRVASVSTIGSNGYSTWDFGSIEASDIATGSDQFWNSSTGSSGGYTYYKSNNAITKNQDPIDIPNAQGKNLFNGMKISCTSNDINAGDFRIWIGLGIQSNRKTTVFTIPTTEGKGYKITIGATSATSSDFGFNTHSSFTLVDGSLTPTISTAYTEDAAFIIKANGSTITLPMNGANNSGRIILKSIEEVELTKYSVTYDLNGGTGTLPTETDKLEGEKFNLHNGTTDITAPTGKEFAGWNDGTNTYDGGAEYTMPDDDVILTAQWENIVVKHSITYNANGGSGTMSETKVVDGEDQALPANTFTRTCYSFDGWKADVDVEISGATVTAGTLIADGATIENVAEDITLTAQWTANYSTSLDFASVVLAKINDGTEPPAIATFLAGGNMVGENVDQGTSGWETGGDWHGIIKEGYLGYKVKYSGAKVSFLAPAGKLVTIVLGSVGANVTLSKNGTTSTISSKSGDDAETIVTPFVTEEDMLVSLTTTNTSTVTLKNIIISDYATASISDAEYATFVNAEKALDFSTTGITVYTAQDKETSVGLTEIENGQVPANTPVVLYKEGADGSAIYVPAIASAAAIEGTNDLRVSTGTDVENMYVLAMNPTIGFYPWTGTNLPAGKIYLQGKASYGAREFLGFDATTTSIDNVVVKTIDANAPMYNLAGQRVNKSYKGIVIVNGKKMLNK